jgi:hypothetical protein
MSLDSNMLLRVMIRKMVNPKAVQRHLANHHIVLPLPSVESAKGLE